MIDIRDCLASVRYPCDRAELLRSATAQGAGDDVLGWLATLPEQEYDSIDTVNRLLNRPVELHGHPWHGPH
ncbi:DUF2795 domain-containing protein [Amycolatopsis benzoatilytica]|uniref:DUF2795 domain-containing protein n=1 Tax=Amycolatopsis benzoatilytica TaxID=346045 RepID=UPI00036DEA52|nr:DUF2795 domain-containing protein [Amycolatopsis benzoatilytica]